MWLGDHSQKLVLYLVWSWHQRVLYLDHWRGWGFAQLYHLSPEFLVEWRLISHKMDEVVNIPFVNTLRLDKMAASLKTIFFVTFSWNKIAAFWFNFQVQIPESFSCWNNRDEKLISLQSSCSHSVRRDIYWKYPPGHYGEFGCCLLLHNMLSFCIFLLQKPVFPQSQRIGGVRQCAWMETVRAGAPQRQSSERPQSN